MRDAQVSVGEERSEQRKQKSEKKNVASVILGQPQAKSI